MTPTEHVTGTMRAVVAGGWPVWLRGMLAGAINGGATAIPVVSLVKCSDAAAYLLAVLSTFGAGALGGALLYLARSPLPWDGRTERRKP